MAAPALSSVVCLLAPKDFFFFLGTELCTRLLWCFHRGRLLILENSSALSNNENDWAWTNSPRKKQCHQELFWTTSFLANKEHSCTVTRHPQCGSRLGCTLEPLNIWYTVLSHLFQIFHTYRKSVADVTFHSAVYFCYFDISQTWKLLFGKVLPSWSQVLTVTTPRNKKERDLFSRYTFQFISTILLQLL